MAKQARRLTRKDKIEIARRQRDEEREALKKTVASLEDRVAVLETPPVTFKQEVGRAKRDFIGKKETKE